MNLIYITSAKIPTSKANGLQIMKACEAFARSGIHTKLVIPFRFNSIKDDPFSYYGVKRIFAIEKVWSLDLFGLKWIPSYLSFYIHALLFTIGSILHVLFKNDRKQDVYYSRNYLPLFFLCLFGFNPVAEIHDYRSYKPKWPIAFILRTARRIVVNSKGTLRTLQNHYQIPPGRVLVAPNGVDVDFFKIKESKKEARQKLGLPLDKVIISYIGRLEIVGVEKGVSHLLKAFGSLIREGRDCVLCVVGGPDQIAEEYKKTISSLDIPPNHSIFTGYVEYKKIPLYLRAVDIVVIPLPKITHSITTSPIKVFEFLAAGKVIVASDFPSLRPFLNERNAVFFEPENSSDLAEKLGKLLDNWSWAADLSEQAGKDSQKHSWLNRAEKIITFIS